MLPYLIVAGCLAACILAALLPVTIAYNRKSPTGDPYLDHLYKIGATNAAEEIIDGDSMLYGTWHDAEIIPSKTIQGSIIKDDQYDRGPSPYHAGRHVRKIRKNFGEGLKPFPGPQTDLVNAPPDPAIYPGGGFSKT